MEQIGSQREIAFVSGDWRTTNVQRSRSESIAEDSRRSCVPRNGAVRNGLFDQRKMDEV